MKSRPFLWILLILTCGGAGLRAVESAPLNYGAEMSVNADVQEDFFRRYPDLEDERDVVAIAARTLATEGVETKHLAAAAELLAKRTRDLLQRRTPQEWQQKAVSLFPDLGVAGSKFNAAFLRHFNDLKQTSPQFLEEPSWPVLLARRCADEMKIRPRPTAKISAPPVETKSATPIASAPISSAPRAGFWLPLANFLILTVIIVLPARWLWTCRRAFGGSDGPVTLWQRALGPAAWAYLAVALAALVRTFLANADQRPFDRFGITLLVSLVAGVAVALPAYGLALGSIWWWRQRTLSRPEGHDGELHGTGAISAGGRKV